MAEIPPGGDLKTLSHYLICMLLAVSAGGMNVKNVNGS